MARAKRTDRTEARRRYRAEQAAITAGPDADDTGEPEAAARPTRPAKGTPAQATTPTRPSLTSALRGAFRPVDLRADLRALPKIVTHWGFLASIGLAIASTALFIVSTNGIASTLDLTLSNPMSGKEIGPVSNLSYLAVSLFVAPPPAAGAFLVGFTAPRASWLGGLLFGFVAAACYSVILLSPTGALFVGANDPGPYIANAWVVAPLGATLFAAGSAWYKRFLNLANPNRGRPQSKPQQGRGNARPNSRAAASRRP